MNKREIAVLATRILAICVWVQAVLYLAVMFDIAGRMVARAGNFPADWWNCLGALLPLTMLVLAGGVLWAKGGWIADRMVGLADDAGPVQCPTGVEEIQAAAFSVVGLVILALTIPSMAELLVNLLWLWASGQNLGDQGQSIIVGDPVRMTVSSLVRSVIRLALGVWLLLGSRTIVRAIRRFRTFT
jgi:hypothetical protein